MRTIIHLSDLHFGRTDEAVAGSLAASLAAAKPDLVIVSGDLTQRARAREFLAARAFLDALPAPHLVVPGNHDIPLYNIPRRILHPYRDYRTHIDQDLEPVYEDADLLIVGVNTTRPSSVREGAVSPGQVERLARLFGTSAARTKIVVGHHPFDIPEGSTHPLVRHAARAMRVLQDHRVDLFLAGHAHIHHVGSSATRYKLDGHASLLVQAGTAISTRTRRETNSFNVLRLDPPKLRIETYRWQPQGNAFLAEERGFVHDDVSGWREDPNYSSSSSVG